MPIMTIGGEEIPKEKAMRKLLLLMALCALVVLLFASEATATSSATAAATASASGAGAAQYQYASASALPGTGGVSPAALVAIVPAILLLGSGGLLAAKVLRRS